MPGLKARALPLYYLCNWWRSLRRISQTSSMSIHPKTHSAEQKPLCSFKVNPKCTNPGHLQHRTFIKYHRYLDYLKISHQSGIYFITTNALNFCIINKWQKKNLLTSLQIPNYRASLNRRPTINGRVPRKLLGKSKFRKLKKCHGKMCDNAISVKLDFYQIIRWELGSWVLSVSDHWANMVSAPSRQGKGPSRDLSDTSALQHQRGSWHHHHITQSQEQLWSTTTCDPQTKQIPDTKWG